MNTVDRISQNVQLYPNKMALWSLETNEITFLDFWKYTIRAQAVFRRQGVKVNSQVLVAVPPSIELYAGLIALMGLGAKIIFIEPWLKLDRIDHVLKSTKPEFFFTSFLGKLWGLRSSEIRKIKNWITPSMFKNDNQTSFISEALPEDHPVFIAFSSGTTGSPKGAIRTQKYLNDIQDVLMNSHPYDYKSPDLVVFPNVVLLNLGNARGAVCAPPNWKVNDLKKMLGACEHYRPETISAGPGFMKQLLTISSLTELNSLKEIIVGGALTDCKLFEQIFNKFPERKFLHIYGGSEAEPVSFGDAQNLVKLSQEKNYFQTLALGKPIAAIKTKIRDEILWVSGKNVAPEYIGNPKENEGVKERDEKGVLWHCMGDKIAEDAHGLWFMGKKNQTSSDFLLEQNIYQYLGHSAAFLHREPNQNLRLILEGNNKSENEIKARFPEISSITKTKIKRDRRHRARIDRKATLNLKE
jgi:acyl-CoA synthetase (AMP-forming)/AMP-acid ligase II